MVPRPPYIGMPACTVTAHFLYQYSILVGTKAHLNICTGGVFAPPGPPFYLITKETCPTIHWTLWKILNFNNDQYLEMHSTKSIGKNIIKHLDAEVCRQTLNFPRSICRGDVSRKSIPENLLMRNKKIRILRSAQNGGIEKLEESNFHNCSRHTSLQSRHVELQRERPIAKWLLGQRRLIITNASRSGGLIK